MAGGWRMASPSMVSRSLSLLPAQFPVCKAGHGLARGISGEPARHDPRRHVAIAIDGLDRREIGGELRGLRSLDGLTEPCRTFRSGCRYRCFLDGGLADPGLIAGDRCTTLPGAASGSKPGQALSVRGTLVNIVSLARKCRRAVR
jgi:hypothetical protein